MTLSAPPHSVLQWSNGLRQQTDCGGGISIVYMLKHPDGRFDHVTFHLLEGSRDPRVYVESSRKDATAGMAKAERDADARYWALVRRGLDLDDEPGDSWLTRTRRRIARWVRP